MKKTKTSSPSVIIMENLDKKIVKKLSTVNQN